MSSSTRQKELHRKWLTHKAKFSKKELLINNYQVMQSWEKNYMADLAEIATSKGGHILEFGFGMGISAEFIQKSSKIISHTIIECHPDVVAHAGKKYSKQIGSGRLTLINGFWEDVSSKLKDNYFSGILFDTSPLDKETVFFHYFPVFKEIYRLLKKGGVFSYFSDEAVEISPKHQNLLVRAGFDKNKIDYRICKINPPSDCRYWKEKTIVTPIIHK